MKPYFKSCFFAFVLLLSAPVVAVERTAWTQVSAEKLEIQTIMQNIQRIKEYFTAMGGGNSGAKPLVIFEYLKKIGTPASFKILKSLIEDGTLPKHFLNMA